MRRAIAIAVAAAAATASNRPAITISRCARPDSGGFVLRRRLAPRGSGTEPVELETSPTVVGCPLRSRSSAPVIAPEPNACASTSRAPAVSLLCSRRPTWRRIDARAPVACPFPPT